MHHFTFIWRNDSVASAIKKLLNKGGTYSLENDYRANFGVSLIKWHFLGELIRVGSADHSPYPSGIHHLT
jgi:hypothetical protein